MVMNRRHLYKILCIVLGLKLGLLSLLYLRSDSILKSQIFKERSVNIDELLIDRRAEPTWEQRLELILEDIPSLPLVEMLAAKDEQQKLKCAPLSKDIEFHNDYWQVAHAENLTYYLFGAYYDCRETVVETPLVRLLAMINERGNTGAVYPKTHCQLWFKSQLQPVIVPVLDHKVIWFWWKAANHFYPTLMECAVPSGEVPAMVSLVLEPCEKATNLLKVFYESAPLFPEQKQLNETTVLEKDGSRPLKFAVCVKTMNFLYTDMSWRLIEWLELMRLLGAEKIVFYNGPMHANMTRVLRHYVDEDRPGFVELRPMSLARGEPNSPVHFHHYALGADNFNSILNEMIPYNDCFYRNMYRYDYIGLFDIDEVIMPLGNFTTWSDLLKFEKQSPDPNPNCKDSASFCFRNAYFPNYEERPKFFQQFPAYFYMLQHVERTREYCDPGDATKCFHSTSYAIGLHNHAPLYWKDRICSARTLDVQYAQLHHYREPDTKSKLLDTVVDDNIWRFQPQLQNRTMAKYRKLGFLPTTRQQRRDEEELQN
ncbi:uncharacterized protein LOC115632654 [Scaptodrosophila lebanonensis]|uniref:Glycosyltransferase family 92 protein n=1 Tax=Drosophila lebanonensis TaxID=7225 RepID=A0A6J2UCF1_DROLE|nr:uncharacterized protein LOC115632654 [Scaptodrosophila lebanonensis]